MGACMDKEEGSVGGNYSAGDGELLACALKREWSSVEGLSTTATVTLILPSSSPLHNPYRVCDDCSMAVSSPPST